MTDPRKPTVHLPSIHGAIAVAQYDRFPRERGVTIRRAHTARKVHLTETEALAVINAVADMIGA
ncbi:hypothetical protein TUM20983_27780 [Mycobacterium antarcticum]|nr:hypothetical protein TUM20983_27780 [Mycolicibacterium sp. TUM20983]GLP83981.1 hypothetical protein TUM20984_54010 [Mycolicibacterium sp. TUM20984]